MNEGHVDRFTLTARSGEPIAVEKRPAGPSVRGAVLISPAMATRSRYYAPLAEWLRARGFTTYVFDYQGYGASARTPLREVRADFLTWGDDAALVADRVRADCGDLPLTWLGHSLGGQLLAFTSTGAVDAAVIVASGTGYWRDAEGRDRLLAPLLWYVVAPVLTRVCGYYPGRAISLLGDIPGPVMRQWGSWCRNPGYMLGVHPELRSMFARFRGPLVSLSFTDDATMSTTATRRLESWYTGAELDQRRIEPADVGRQRIGHMGLFHRDATDLWERLLLPTLAVGAG